MKPGGCNGGTDGSALKRGHFRAIRRGAVSANESSFERRVSAPPVAASDREGAGHASGSTGLLAGGRDVLRACAMGCAARPPRYCDAKTDRAVSPDMYAAQSLRIAGASAIMGILPLE